MTATAEQPDTTPRQQIELGEDTARWLDALHQARAQIAEWERIAERATDKVKAAMGDAEEAVVDGRTVARWAYVNSSRVDVKKLEAEHPDLAEQFRVPTVVRRFTLPSA